MLKWLEPSGLNENDINNWYFMERQNNNNTAHNKNYANDNGGRLHEDESKSSKSRTKDFLKAEYEADSELNAMSKLSLYDGTDIDKIKLDDKWVEKKTSEM